MPHSSGNFWKLGLIPQAIANGLASILVLLFLISNLHGGLFDIGLVAGVSALALIPSQVLWGRLTDSVGRCKPFLLIGFVGMGVSFVAVPLVGSISALVAIVSVKSILWAATLPARQLLTVESEQREGWQKGLADMQFLVTLGETMGMGVGAALVASLGFGQLFMICGALCGASAIALGVLAQEPGIMIQRRLVALDRSTSTLVAVSDIVGTLRLSPNRIDYGKVLGSLNRSTKYLMFGIFIFSLAGAAFYSPLPAYFLRFYSAQAVFLVFFGGSLAGAISYLIVGRRAGGPARSLALSTSVRTMVIPLLLFAALGAAPGLAVAAVVLAVLEAVWSLFDVSSMFAFLETAHVGQAGFYGALVGLGSAGGGFLGGYISMRFDFAALFMLCSILCAGAFTAFFLQFRSRRFVR
ncbi:MAG TPA: MFS transporter [Nitrososphaerales archaeon]|nr:MFS transporter [Nitrososphaerales archaeon]